MANSDNVVRAGLTPKLIDVETLLGMLQYTCQVEEAALPAVQNSELCLALLPALENLDSFLSAVANLPYVENLYFSPPLLPAVENSE